MKITENQIEEFYLFTRKYFVEWYDVQSKLVDHLANGIEAQLEENSNLTFEECLNIGIYAPLFSHSDEEWTLTSQFIFSFFVVLYVLFFYIALKVVSPKLKEKLSREHPEYNLI